MHIRGRARLALLSGIIGATAVAGSFLAVGYTDEFVGAALAHVALDVLPPVAFAYGLVWLGALARPLLVVSTTTVGWIAFGVTAGVVLRLTADRGIVRTGSAVLVSFAVVGFLLTWSPASALGASVAGAVTAIAAVSAVQIDGRPDTVRRQFLRSSATFLGVLGLGAVVSLNRERGTKHEHPSLADSDVALDDEAIPELLTLAAERSFELPHTEPLVSEDFYRVDITVTGFPDSAPDDWSLSILGDVDRELDLDFDALTAYPAEHRFVTLRCVGDALNGRLIDTALWTGTPLAPLLDVAGAGENCCVRLEAADGYYQAFPREALERGFLAWGMNGEPLPAPHGAPVRVLIPGHWGEINVKWLETIEIRDEPATGYWEERGWHGTGPVETVAKVHTYRRDGDRVLVGGPAYGGTRGISAVEVSTDDGETWEHADLTVPLPGSTRAGEEVDPDTRAADALRLWRYEYERGDRHEVLVRATEWDGTPQPRTETGPFPRGATGWVSRSIYANRTDGN